MASEQAVDRPDQQPSLFLDLHYLLTYWGTSAEAEQTILGWVMLQLETNPVLEEEPGETSNPEESTTQEQDDFQEEFDQLAKLDEEWREYMAQSNTYSGRSEDEEERRQFFFDSIVNPETLDYVRANDTCIQCHSQGQPLTNPIAGKYFDWPVGYEPGRKLADYWKLEELKPGVTNFYQYADMTAHKNRMQGNDFVQSNMYHRELRCFDCHNVHSNENVASVIAKGNALCLKCHTGANPAGLKGTVSEHTHHAPNSAGSQCTACHMPRIEQTIKDNFVGSHTFRFISPVLTQQFNIPNPCTSCHAEKSNEWALRELRGWTNVSAWRVAP